jgi:hypothetical protein
MLVVLGVPRVVDKLAQFPFLFHERSDSTLGSRLNLSCQEES